jgi:hypothetical protein
MDVQMDVLEKQMLFVDGKRPCNALLRRIVLFALVVSAIFFVVMLSLERNGIFLRGLLPRPNNCSPSKDLSIKAYTSHFIVMFAS